MSDDDDWLADQPGQTETQRPRPQVSLAEIQRQQQVRQTERPASGGCHQQEEVQQGPRVLARPKEWEIEESSVLDKPAPKTMKQKEAEYAAARARIFGGGSKGGGAAGPTSGGAAARNGNGKGQGKGGKDYGRGAGGYGGSYDRNSGSYSQQPQQQQQQQQPRSNGGGGKGAPRQKKHDDDDDPDYNRDSCRFAARLAPAEAEEPPYSDEEEEVIQPKYRQEKSRYQPPTYESEFPSL